MEKHELEKAIDRIEKMEQSFNELQAAAGEDFSVCRKAWFCRELDSLMSYYENGLWLYDFELDEKGLLPPTLKRGILSEDGLHNFLSKVKAYNKACAEANAGESDGKKADADERLKKQLAFSLEIDKEKNIFRQTHLSGHGRNENDAEHAWHMAIMAYLLREYSNEKVDIAKVMIMCLIHDIVEIDAGDTYAYDDESLKTQKEREDKAKERIFSILPDDQKAELTALFDEFEAHESAESKFAHAMDNLQPLILNNSNLGGDWREHNVSAKQVYKRQEKTKLGSNKLYEITEQIIKENIDRGSLKE